MNLRELTSDQEAILAQVENGDFSLDDVSDHLDMLEEDRNKKIESYLHVINNLQSKLNVKTEEIKRIEILRDANHNALTRVKEWLMMSMKDGEKHEFDLFKVTRVKGREVVKVTNSELVPEKYLTHHEESWSTNKKAILTALKTGEEVKGAEITTGNPSLRIK